MPTSPRRLDVERLWELAAEQYLSPAALMRRAGIGAGDGRALLDPLSGRSSLAVLSAAQLVKLAEVLEVTVEELLTSALPARDRHGDAGQNNGLDIGQGQRIPAPSTGPVPEAAPHRRSAAASEPVRRPPVPSRRAVAGDRAALAAALLAFGAQAPHTLLEALEWTPGRLETAISGLHRALESSGLTVCRSRGRIQLADAAQTLPRDARGYLTAKRARNVPIDPALAPFLLVALRAYSLGPYPGQPWTPRKVAEDLARQHAAAAPDHAAPHPRPGQQAPQVRLTPHPDLLFALHMTARPGPWEPP